MFILRGLEGLNRKSLENRPPLKFDFAYWEGVSAQFWWYFQDIQGAKSFSLKVWTEQEELQSKVTSWLGWLKALIQKVQTWQILINQAVNCIEIFKVMFLSWWLEEFCISSSVYQQYWKKYTSTGKSRSNILIIQILPHNYP